MRARRSTSLAYAGVALWVAFLVLQATEGISLDEAELINTHIAETGHAKTIDGAQQVKLSGSSENLGESHSDSNGLVMGLRSLVTSLQASRNSDPQSYKATHTSS
jgi:hypothetical protein